MTGRPDPDLRISAWLQDEAPDRAPERLLTASRDRIQSTHQRRAWWPARRFSEMSNALKLAIAAAAVVVVALVGINLLPRSGGVGGSGQTPSPSPTPSLTASPSPSSSPSPASFPDGPLAAGSYAIQPFAGSGGLSGLCMGQAGCIEAGAEDDSIRITFTLPDGWTGFNGVVIPTVESYSPPGGAALLFMRGGWLLSELCGGRPDIPTGTTVDEFVTALVDHPDLDVTSPVEVTLGGHSGQYLELRAPANTTTDELGPDPSGCNYYFVWEPGIYAQGPDDLWRIWVLDVDGVRVVIRADTYPGTTAEAQAQLTAIVDSIQIEP